MNITHVIVGLNVGGAELMLKRLILAHANNANYKHTVISLTDLGVVGAQLRDVGVDVTPLNMRGARDLLRTLCRLRKKLRNSQPDIVQTWMYHADMLGGVAAYSLGIRRIIWGIRTTEIRAGGSSLTLIIRKICAFLSHFIPSKIVCAANAAFQVHRDAGYDADKMLVIPNGFAMEALVTTREQVDKLRQQEGITVEHRVVGSVGRFNVVKDQENFVRAAGVLAQKCPEIRFMMVGRDLDSNNLQLVNWIEATGQAKRFVLLGERSDVPTCLAAMDIFCLHSRTEGFPNVVGEAMAMAKPCVVTDVGDAALLVGNTGVVVPKEDPTALARGIQDLLSLAPAEIRSLGVAAQNRILENFTMNHVRMKFEQLYQKEMGTRV